MAKIVLKDGDILSFQGDALILFCDSDLSYKRGNPLFRTMNNNGLKKRGQLLRELASIGYCDIGNAVATKSYENNVKNYIFIPFSDHENSQNNINFILFHRALRSALTLASLYELRKIAIPILRINLPKKDFLGKAVEEIMGKKERLDEKEIEDVIIAISKEFEKEGLEEVTIYR